eukprot:gene9300-10281_t
MASLGQNNRNETTQISSLSNNFEELQIKSKPKKKKEDNASDFLKSLEPGRRKLASVESQRIVSVLDDCCRKIEIVTLLPFILENIDRFSVLLGAELVALVQEYDAVEKKYAKALRKYRQVRSRSATARSDVVLDDNFGGDDASDVSSISDRPMSQLSQHSDWLARAEMDEISTILDSLKETMKNIIRSIVRLFGKNPSALRAINVERKERSFEANNFVTELYSLKDLVFLRLVTSPGEELEKMKQFVNLTMKDDKAKTTIQKQSVNLEAAIKEKDEEIAKLNDAIKGLKTNINNVEKNAEDQNHRIISEAAKAETGEVKNSDGKKSKLQQEIIQLKQSLQSNLTTHRESELTLRKRKYKIETEVENWIQKFDNDMGERQDEFDELDSIYTEEKRQLKILEERFETLEGEYKTIMEERRIAREKREAAERELKAMIKAATFIQAFWRAFKMRKALKNKKKKGKKGKGKGKKKR